MAFVVKKKINNNDYYYLNENKRDSETGKVKTKTLAYLGKVKKDADKKAKEIIKKMEEEKTEEIVEREEKKLGVVNDIREVHSSESKEFISFVREAGFIWGPEPEIYGGLAGFYTYGPLGKLLKNKVENSVRKIFNSHGFRELEAPTVLPDIVWKASGHLDTFSDRTIKCSKCDAIFRADKIIEEKYDVAADAFSEEKLLSFIKEKNIKCPNCKSYFEEKIESQSLMMKTVVAGQDAALRPETATATYIPYLRFYNYFRKKLPLGVFQIGKAYRNEISPRQSVLRGREFTQAEGQIFVDPEFKNNWDKYDSIKKDVLPFFDYESQDDESGPKNISIEEALKKGFIKSQAYGWCIWLAHKQFVGFGIPNDRIRLRQHHPDEKAFYADDAWDIEVKLNNYGWTEVCGVHDRTDYDLKQHAKFSNTKLEAIRENGEKFVPHVLEIAFGTDRPTYALIDLFYDKKEITEGKTVFRIPPHMAPIDVSIFPLLKTENLIEFAQEIKSDLEKEFIVDYDSSGSIGKRYLRSSSAGVPFAITVDEESLKNKDVTVRERDTTKQIRVPISDLKNILRNLIFGEIDFEKAGVLVN